MKILREYVWDTVRQNKRTSIAIMVALFLMTAMMSSFCGFVYTMWTDAVAMSKWENGDWHGELYGTTYGKDLEKIENYDSVSAVMVKGDWEVAQISGQGRRNYIIVRGANEEYWKSMSEKDSIIEGRYPVRDKEIALPKQYFDDYPEIKIGDTLTLPVGERIYNGIVCMATERFHEEETFRQTGTKTYTIVGKMDVTTSSVVPAYAGMGYLDTRQVKPDDEITVYLRFDPMRDTYKELPKLAKAVGYEKDEYGEYILRYNVDLLTKNAILSPEQKGALDHLGALAVPLMFLVIAALLVAVFVLVIHNAFALSANDKRTQLGTLAGIGASPRQIRFAVTTEAMILSVIPVPLGIFLGWFLNIQMFRLINASNDIGRTGPDIIPSFGLMSILPALVLSLLTAWISARIPAKKIARMLPVEALRKSDDFNKRKLRKSQITSRFGIAGELAGNALSARKKSYRTAAISLTMSFLLLTGFLYITSAQQASKEIYRAKQDETGHIFVNISDGRIPDQEALEAMKQTPGITGSIIYNKLTCATWITEDKTSEDIETHLGGFDKIVESGKYSPIERDGKYRIQSLVIGLEPDSFREYCRQQGIDPEAYFQDNSKALIYNYTEDPEVSTKKESVYRELLKIKEGEKITFTEKAYDEDEGDFTFDLTAGALVTELPGNAIKLSRYTLVALMPMDHVLTLAASCSERRQTSACNVNGIFLTDSTGGISYKRIEKVSAQMDKALYKYYGTGDYMVSDLAMQDEMQKETQGVVNIIVAVLTGLLAVIGLSNAWASISGNLRQRSREFAMLKSAGLSPNQLWKMLFLEGLTLGLKPLLISIPFQAVILGLFLSINEVSLAEYVPYAPYAAIGGYTCLILIVIVAAYLIGGRRIQRENIISAVRDETI